MGKLVARLKGAALEDAQALLSTQVRDRFGQVTPQFALTAGEVLKANVQPLGAETALQLGLSTDTERLRVTVYPPTLLTARDRLRLRGRDWAISHVEVWPSHTLLILEGVP